MAGTVQEQQWAAIEKALSSDRLEGYKRADDPDYDLAVARYLYNSALCEALYPTLHCLEVVLRNRLDAAICVRFGQKWLRNERLLDGGKLRRIAEARDHLAFRGKPAPTHADLVAELSLGFWVGLFERSYERADKLWPTISRPVMSGAPSFERTRANFYTRLDRVRDLRNRAFHYEPLWYWDDLVDQHESARELLAWFSPEVAALAATIDRFANVHASGVDAYTCLVAGGFICPVHHQACRRAAGGDCPSAPRPALAVENSEASTTEPPDA